jgi:hypothetical protein
MWLIRRTSWFFEKAGSLEISAFIPRFSTALYNASSKYAKFLKVDQKHVELPTIDVEGEKLTLQLSCLLMNRVAGGGSARVGDKVLDNFAKFYLFAMHNQYTRYLFACTFIDFWQRSKPT